MVTRGTFQGEDAMEDKRLAAIGPNPSGLRRCGCGRKTKIVTKSDRRLGHIMGQPFRFIFIQASIDPNPSAVHVRVWAKDEDCDEKRSATRSCNGSAFSIYSWPQSPRREGSKQIQTSSPYSGYLPRASKRDGSRMPSIPKRFSQSKETSLVRK